jgi:tRNA U34 5-carboxymethylaminomethyl modifying GTPase MnmE/TrmE
MMLLIVLAIFTLITATDGWRAASSIASSRAMHLTRSVLSALTNPTVLDDAENDIGYQSSPFQSGFVSIIGNPNVGKSSLLNNLLGQKLSIVSPKPQTTRHRILGVLTESNYQLIFSDTPGMLSNNAYKLHDMMMETVSL